MKKICLTIVLAVLALFCSCKKENEKRFTEDGREIVVLAEVIGDSFIDELVADFNNQSEEYFVEQRTYYSMDNGLYTCNEKLLMDVTRGEKIDIMYNEGLDMEAYINKNMLADMYVLIDEDGEVSRDTYMEGALKAFESNGRLCSMPTNFYIQTTIGKESIWQGDRDVSIQNLTKKAAELNAVPIANLSKSTDKYSKFSYYMNGMLEEFIDFENNTCNFTDGRFEQLLEFADAYDIGAEDPKELFAEGKSLLHHVTITNYADIDMYKALFGPDIVFMGFPSDTPNCHNITSTECFSILESSAIKRGAFEFIKYITSYDYQIEDAFASFLSINKEVFDTVAYYSLFETYTSYLSADMTVKVEYACTQESIDAVREQLESIGSGFTWGETLSQMINEEANSFFSHDKSAADICDIIQNRVSTYLSEHKD